MPGSEVRKMKQIKKGILFLLVFALLLVGISALTEEGVKRNAQNIQGRNRPVAMLSAAPDHSLDVLVTGDSESYTSVSTMELWKDYGMAIYNCGQGAQRIQETYYLLKHALRNQKPELVIIETNALFRDPGMMKNVQLVLAETIRYYMPVFRYHNLWKLLFDDPKPERVDYLGFQIRAGRKAYSGKEYMKETEKKREIPCFVRYYLDEIRTLCERNGVKLLFVSAPSPKNHNYKRHNAVETYADGNQIPYLDLNLKLQELGINWETDSYDGGDHLNLSGAKKVTKYLGEYLKANYTLKDHRGERLYESWDDLALEYDKEVRRHLK